MNKHFLFVYRGSDGTSKLRMLSRDTLGQETSPSDVEYFVKQETAGISIPIPENSKVYVCQTFGGVPGKFDFRDVRSLFIMDVPNEDRVWKLLEDVPDGGARVVFQLVATSFYDLCKTDGKKPYSGTIAVH